MLRFVWSPKLGRCRDPPNLADTKTMRARVKQMWEQRDVGATSADWTVFESMLKGIKTPPLSWKTVQRYDEQITFCKFFETFFVFFKTKKMLVHRFTDSRISVSWKNLHNNIIILYIIYLLWAKYEDTNLCEFVNLWILLGDYPRKCIFLKNFCEKIWKK